jgi:hypothetical protein
MGRAVYASYVRKLRRRPVEVLRNLLVDGRKLLAVRAPPGKTALRCYHGFGCNSGKQQKHKRSCLRRIELNQPQAFGGLLIVFDR